MCIEKIVKIFEGITLSQMDSVKLMNRTDRKYWFNIAQLEQLLEAIKDDYYILEVEGSRNMPYSTTYYDTPKDQMYLNHHRGKLNRYKIRRRSYELSGVSFLEVKFKSNKGRTIKERIKAPYDAPCFSGAETKFITEHTPYLSSELNASLLSGFHRLMLVSRTMDERCTIDHALVFSSEGVEVQLSDLVVVEVKTEGRAKSAIVGAMKRQRIKSSGFSKYCIGRSVTSQSLKNNAFKLKHRLIEKTINTKIEELLKVV